jgi:UDP-N-acetylglucosamine diphosphorylase/glucosamine-1-phosphate N-acetyltransferase
MRLCLVEDQAVAGLEPLTLTRAASDLLLGQTTLGSKIARAFGVGPGPARRGLLVRPHLAAVVRQADPHTTVNDPDWLARGPVVVARARWVPPAQFSAPGKGSGWVGLCDGTPAYAHVTADMASGLRPSNVDDWFEDLLGRPDYEAVDVGGDWIGRPWDLVQKNNDFIVRDFGEAGPFDISNRHLSQLAVVGSVDRLRVHETARIDPYVVFDTTNGPITISAGVWIQPFTRVEGPATIGARTQLFRANLRGGVTIGPNCRIGGEVESTIIQGHSNKYHEGFLGHAYVGEWVNLGAITSNSDLRNDYGEVFVPLQGEPIATGQAKVGCFIGDHTRTGLGSMLNTGTSIGVMCNVLPAGPLLPKHVPSFCAVMWGRVAPGFPIDQMFQTARTVKGRRGLEFTAVEEQLFSTLYEQTRLERERAYQRARERRGGDWPMAAVGR